MLMLGLNPSDQECVDIPNEFARKGLLYFPDFCDVVLERFRPSKEEEEDFYQHVFKVNNRMSSSATDDIELFKRLFAELILSQLIFGLKNTNSTITK